MKNTKDRILDVAIELFNHEGTSSVSTNHIAKELGISTGNLYYHYQNKEEIIRAIFEKMIREWDVVWQAPALPWEPTIEDLKKIIRTTFQLEWKYRFFYRELIVLMKVDPLLKERHQSVQKQRMTEQQVFFQYFIKAGVLRIPEDQQLVGALLKISWMISNYWLAFLETSGEVVSEENIEQGIELMMMVIKPYIVEER
ncbi:TetR/AcrR family transcriptional regulator [Bacillus alkalicellulosilyticus]|uniref:TetR/AcrR family transcriptional regulator n=1 Tax=Alkalihalobacterium alkalicellulosilyticum TaxID=1912214 RepID=UPI000996A9DE|nr:TetR/AcrR family transcriptional regulator [Bacillus alkalicellulosilyticus]